MALKYELTLHAGARSVHYHENYVILSPPLDALRLLTNSMSSPADTQLLSITVLDVSFSDKGVHVLPTIDLIRNKVMGSTETKIRDVSQMRSGSRREVSGDII